MPKHSARPARGRSFNPQNHPGDDPVGTALRRLHDDVVAEPLPEEFLRLLNEIEEKIGRRTGEE